MPVRERGEARDGGEHHAAQDRALACRGAPAQQGTLKIQRRLRHEGKKVKPQLFCYFSIGSKKCLILTL